jgi:hypothetical protein
MLKADKLIVLALFVCIISAQARGETVYFFVGERYPFRNDGYVLALSNPADIAHARYLIDYGLWIGSTIVMATVHRLPSGTCGVNRNYAAEGVRCWSWEV